MTGTLWGEGSSPATGSSRCPGAPPGGCARCRRTSGRSPAPPAAGRRSTSPAWPRRGAARRVRRPRRRRVGRDGPAGRRAGLAARRRAEAAHARSGFRRSSGRPRCRPPACCWRPTRWSRASAATPSCGWGGRCPRRPVTAWCCAPPSAARWAGPSSSTRRPPGTGAAAARPSGWRCSSGARRPGARPAPARGRGRRPRGGHRARRGRRRGGVVLPGGLALDAGVAARARERLREALGSPLSLAAARAATGLGTARGPRAPRRPRGAGGGRARRCAAPPPCRRAAARARGGRRGPRRRRAAPPLAGGPGRATGLAPAQVEAALGRLREGGRAVRAGDLWFDAAAAAGARDHAREALASGPMTIGALRDLWAVGRRQAIALAAHLDASGLTRRQGDAARCAGGAPEPAPGPDAGGLRAPAFRPSACLKGREDHPPDAMRP